LGKSLVETSLIAPSHKFFLAFSIREGRGKNKRERCWFVAYLTNGGRERWWNEDDKMTVFLVNKNK
jgi:hypothetical protein